METYKEMLVPMELRHELREFLNDPKNHEEILALARETGFIVTMWREQRLAEFRKKAETYITRWVFSESVVLPVGVGSGTIAFVVEFIDLAENKVRVSFVTYQDTLTTSAVMLSDRVESRVFAALGLYKHTSKVDGGEEPFISAKLQSDEHKIYDFEEALALILKRDRVVGRRRRYLSHGTARIILLAFPEAWGRYMKTGGQWGPRFFENLAGINITPDTVSRYLAAFKEAGIRVVRVEGKVVKII